MSIRTEVKEVAVALGAFGQSLVDGDKETANEYFTMIYNIVKEGSDFAKIPQEERLKAILHAFALAGAETADKSITYSDEVNPA